MQLIMPLGADLQCKVLQSLTKELRHLNIQVSEIGASGGLNVRVPSCPSELSKLLIFIEMLVAASTFRQPLRCHMHACAHLLVSPAVLLLAVIFTTGASVRRLT